MAEQVNPQQEEVIAASVNTKFVEKWDTNDFLRWIKVLQDRRFFEGAKVDEADTMSVMIKQKKYSGKELINCNTLSSFVKLFKGKIKQKTARVLQENLSMERQMFAYREQSKYEIRNGKWKPRVGEKIRCIEDRYKQTPFRSYPARIGKVLQNQILVCYDGYPDNQGDWVKREQWAGKITILENRNKSNKTQTNKQKPNKAAPPKPTKAKSQRNTMNPNDSNQGLPKRRSVPPTDAQYVPPFHNKRVAQWNNDDITDWIASITVPENLTSQAQKGFKKDKEKFTKAILADRVNGLLLLPYTNGDKLYKDYKHRGISQAFCGFASSKLRDILKVQQAFPLLASGAGFSSKGVQNWTTDDLQAWVKSLNLGREKKIIAAIKKAQFTGQDFAVCNSASEICAALSVSESIGEMLFQKLKKVRGKSAQMSNPTDDNVNRSSYRGTQASLQTAKEVLKSNDRQQFNTKNDNKNNQLTSMLLDDAPVVFEIGQKFEAKDGVNPKWYRAIVKEVKPARVKIGWLYDKWASAGYDQWIGKYEWDVRIRNPQTKRPYRPGDNARGNYSGTSDKVGNRNAGQSFNYKHINKWTWHELQEWVESLNLSKNNKKKVVAAIEEQEISGEDFNSMTEVSEVMDSFQIKQPPATQIFDALSSIRKNSKDNNVSQSRNSGKQSQGIIGLDNLRNTCFINSVIQCLLQTPGLVPYLRKFAGQFSQEKSSGGWFSWGSSSSSKASNMLDAFIEVEAAALQQTRHESIPPKAIVKYLRASDVKFSYGEQGDALSAVSKMTELLDKHIIAKAKKSAKGKSAKKHAGSWHMEMKHLEDDEHDEEEIIEGQFLLYNPYESVIREYIHFVERNLFTCLKCGWQEARYDIKEKVLLPLKDHSTKIFIDIYIPSAKKTGPILTRHECVILGYCPIQTLRYQIFNDIRTNKGIKCKLDSVEQISIRTLKVDKKRLLSGWIEEMDAKEDCSRLTKTRGSIFAVVDSNKSKSNKNLITVTTFNVRLNKKGDADPKQCYLEFDEMKLGSFKSFDTIEEDKNYPKKHMHIYFGEKIYNYDYQCRVTHKNATIVVIWTHGGAKRRHTWLKPDTTNIDLNWECEIWNDNNGNMANYEDCEQFIQGKIKQYAQYAQTLDKATKTKFEKQWIQQSLTGALVAYKALASDQNKAMELIYEAFSKSKQTSVAKRSTKFVQDISSGFATYCSTKVLDRGAVLKCRGKCKKKCEVFKQETKIVRFSDVLIFAIDRYINNSKFEDVVGYNEFETFGGQKYELYGVCNHSGTNNYGHYWAYVKGYNNNQWYNANDSSIRKINVVGQVIAQDTAILLFYKKAK